MWSLPSYSTVLTDRLLRSWIRCKRKAWLDRYGDGASRVWSAHRTLQLDHQQRSFAKLIPNKPARGIEACKTGCESVMGLRLKGIGASGESIHAHPPLLQRIAGESCWGGFAYRPVLARQGRKVTREHRLTLSLTGLLLEQLQKTPVTKGLIISKVNNELEVQSVPLNTKLQKELIDTLAKLNAALKKSEPPSLTSDRRKCSLCSWKGVCNAEAALQGDLSEVSGIGAKRRQKLQEIGIKTIQDLAITNPKDLRNSLQHLGIQNEEVAQQLVGQAKAQNSGQKERLGGKLSLPELRNAPGLLLYDIESDPDSHDDFLHGFIHLECKKDNNWDLQGAKYQPILALSEHGKSLCWKRLKRKLSLYKNWPILHYGETEIISLLRLAQEQGEGEEELSCLRNRFIDIHARLRLHWRLPLNSYGLKKVANWAGFEWHQEGLDGARALLWWRQWRGSKKNSRYRFNLLKWLFQYNQDDCLATWAVAEWLLKQDSTLTKINSQSQSEILSKP